MLLIEVKQYWLKLRTPLKDGQRLFVYKKDFKKMGTSILEKETNKILDYNPAVYPITEEEFKKHFEIELRTEITLNVKHACKLERRRKAD